MFSEWIKLYKINFENRFCWLTCFMRKLRYGLYVDFQNDFRDVITAWWIIWIMALSYTQWLPNYHEVQKDYDMIFHKDRFLHPTRYWRVADLWLVYPTRDWRVADLWIVRTTEHDMITAQGLISAPYQILEANGFMDRLLHPTGY